MSEDDNVGYFVADGAVNRVPPSDDPWCPEPVLTVEVLSESTRAADFGIKLPAYRRIPTLDHILLVETREMHIEHWRREGWHVRDLSPGATVVLGDFGVLLGVGGLYRGLPVAMGWGGSQEAARGGNRPSTARVIPGGSSRS